MCAYQYWNCLIMRMLWILTKLKFWEVLLYVLTQNQHPGNWFLHGKIVVESQDYFYSSNEAAKKAIGWWGCSCWFSICSKEDSDLRRFLLTEINVFGNFVVKLKKEIPHRTGLRSIRIFKRKFRKYFASCDPQNFKNCYWLEENCRIASIWIFLNAR